MENIKKKKINGWMISTIILGVLYICLMIASLHYISLNSKDKIYYNGVEYENEYAYVNLLVENNTNEQILFDKTNFSIKNTSITKTSSNLYYEHNVSYIQLTGSYILNNNEKVKIKLQFNKSDLNAETTLYYNGSAISKL